MRDKKLDRLVQQLENYLECWKQFNSSINLARTKKGAPEDENQFLEIKSLIVQELELILSSIGAGTPSREEIHTLIAGAPSLRFLSELNDAALRGMESQWHKIYIGWLCVLGQLKVQQQQMESKSALDSLLGKK
jgi:hypothetical protein